MESTLRYASPLGPILLAAEEDAVTGLWFEGQKYFAQSLGRTNEAPLPVLSQAATWLDRYFSGEEPDFLPPLRPRGTPFQRAVWDLLQTIPYGSTTTYGALAKALAARQNLPHMSAQAVGGAVGHNRISLMIPCHRVVGSGGSLTGYAGGLDRKRRLLTLEGVDVSAFSTPARGTAL